MNIPTSGELLGIINQANYSKKQQINLQYAKVIAINAEGKPLIRFLGSNSESTKVYKMFSSYIPKINDTIMLINDIIIGGFSE